VSSRSGWQLRDRETKHFGRGVLVVERGDELGAVAGDERHPDDVLLAVVLQAEVDARDGDPRLRPAACTLKTGWPTASIAAAPENGS